MDAAATVQRGYNRGNAAVKRIMQESKELAAERSRDFHSEPLEDNIFEWHFAIRGPAETDFEVTPGPSQRQRLVITQNRFESTPFWCTDSLDRFFRHPGGHSARRLGYSRCL